MFVHVMKPHMYEPLFHQGGSRAGLELVPNLESVLWVLTAKDPALSQENWLECGSNTLLV